MPSSVRYYYFISLVYRAIKYLFISIGFAIINCKSVTVLHLTDAIKPTKNKKAAVTAAPTMWPNGYHLPYLYQLPDLKYMLE